MARYESSVTSISWIPSEAVQGLPSLPWKVKFTHFDDPPPDRLSDVVTLQRANRFRFANVLRAWIEVNDGEITSWGHEGKSYLGRTRISVGGYDAMFPTFPLPDIEADPGPAEDRVVFRRTAGGRTGLPAPRTVRHPPFVQWQSPLAWTTLELTLHAEGHAEHGVAGASSFPRHWIYGGDGALVAKSGLIDFKTWYREAFGRHTPWGDTDSPALTTEVETALERDLSRAIMRAGAAPERRKLTADQELVRQGDEGDEMFLLLDGVLRVEVNGEVVAEVGPGAILGERAVLEGGRRTATLRAASPCRVAVMGPDQVDREALQELSAGHRREESGP